MWIKRKHNTALLAITLFTTLIVLQLASYNDERIIGDFKSAYHRGTNSFSNLLKKRITKNQLIFPVEFPIKNEELRSFVSQSKTFNLKEFNNPKIFKYDKVSSPLTSNIIHSSYHDHQIDLYNDLTSIDLNLEECDSLKNTISVEINTPSSVDVSLHEILSKFLEEYETNPYYKEMTPFFLTELKLQLEYNVIDHYWYRLAGSSVWLEQYQAHFMISRILYTPKGQRNQPSVSLTYGQLFDKNWKELVNTKIIVPTNNLNTKPKKESQDGSPSADATEEQKEEERHYKIIKFPYFLPIPFWHDYDDTEGKFYGPEDPRLMLVRNKAGYDEPLIIFNAHHRKLTHFDDDTDDRILLKAEFYRSMFICWPWQFQKGKRNTDGFSDRVYDKNYYNKVVELKMKNQPRRGKQKNWTPFISVMEREKDGYDKYVSFVYRWANFEVLNCDLIYGSGICAFTYRLSPFLSTREVVGPLRGGTGLVNINGLLGDRAKKYIPTDREVWVGLARAHLDSCGCGKNMYRPNLVVVTKDTIHENEKFKNQNGDLEYREVDRSMYKISQVSSSISLDIPIIGWDLLNPQDVCTGPNILIPNGISNWDIIDIEHGDDDFEDYMTLSLSISDYTVHRINVKGLLKKLIRVNDGHIFNEMVDTENLEGFNNDNVLCALKGSAEFCYQYGLENSNTEPQIGDIHKIFDDQTFASEEEEEDFNLEQFQEFREVDRDVSAYERALYLQKIHEVYGDKPRYRPSVTPPQRQTSPTKITGAKPDENTKGKSKLSGGTNSGDEKKKAEKDTSKTGKKLTPNKQSPPKGATKSNDVKKAYKMAESKSKNTEKYKPSQQQPKVATVDDTYEDGYDDAGYEEKYTGSKESSTQSTPNKGASLTKNNKESNSKTDPNSKSAKKTDKKPLWKSLTGKEGSDSTKNNKGSKSKPNTSSKAPSKGTKYTDFKPKDKASNKEEFDNTAASKTKSESADLKKTSSKSKSKAELKSEVKEEAKPKSKAGSKSGVKEATKPKPKPKAQVKSKPNFKQQ